MKSGSHTHITHLPNHQDQPKSSTQYNRSPHYKMPTNEDSHTHQSNGFFYLKEEQNKKISTSIKGIGDRIEGV